MKKAIIIGGTSGIGRSLAEILISNNYLVGITGRRKDLLEEIKATKAKNIFIKNFDVTDLSSLNQNLEELVVELGGLDLVVVSAGTGNLNSELSFDIEKDTLDTNVMGFTAVMDWAFNYFKNQNRGHIAAISSIGGLRGNSQAPSYSASKAYQINYLEGLRIKAHKLKIPLLITDIRPGFVDTRMAQGDGLFWVATPEKAADQIYTAIVQKKETIYITKRWKIIAFIFKTLPNFIFNRL